MKINMLMSIALIAGAAAEGIAQAPSAVITLHWRNTQTGGQHPLMPGQTADVWIDVAFSPPVGTPIATPQGVGVLAGLGSVVFDLIGHNNALGPWHFFGSGFAGTPEPNGPWTNVNYMNYGRRQDLQGGWGLSGQPPPPPPPTGGISAGQVGQFPLSPTANSFNPIIEIWRGKWLPADYTPRTARFESEGSFISPHDGVALLVLLPTKFHYFLPLDAANIQWGSVHIPIPSPSTLALLGAGGLVLCRRRRAGAAWTDPSADRHQGVRS